MTEMPVAEHPALLVMDVQRGIVERFGNDSGLLDRIGTAIAAARAAAIPVIYVIIRFREGYPEINPRNRSFSAARQAGRVFGENDPATEIHPAIAPQRGDIVVTKRRVSAFAGSDLDVVLRAQGIDSLILSGIATSGVVLSTLRYAADMDYRLSVLSDCCADSDAEVHRVLMEKVFPRQATILTVDEWHAAIQTAEKH
ncbi:MAG TPA: isochorismatase family cysteine hydrolase [Aggregatilineales bacterium]|nr:isochorismatase family cysteine hydrolase [Aggregatilineales bacterium]